MSCHENCPESHTCPNLSYWTPKPVSAQLFCTGSQIRCLGARGCPQVLFTAVTVPVTVSTSPYIALVINLWLHDVSSRDSLPGDSLLKPVPQALKNVVSGCSTSPQNPVFVMSSQCATPICLRSLVSRPGQPKNCWDNQEPKSRLWLLSQSPGPAFAGNCRVLSPALACALLLYSIWETGDQQTKHDGRKCPQGNPDRLRQPPFIFTPVKCNLGWWAH